MQLSQLSSLIILVLRTVFDLGIWDHAEVTDGKICHCATRVSVTVILWLGKFSNEQLFLSVTVQVCTTTEKLGKRAILYYTIL